ncbi:MAG: hypothetical protein CL558_08290 [Alphaproteobacteria bacterium]|nr:hypothetical protein [Alphaproteobacteria bacterium]MAS46886.1 hypothetical protein [Alphaproteobacteria bacterium]MAX94981.1 hypothetical protein [Alphaproteobacteria bacterium]MBN53564.1 hypothetical protein [Alphaproteobacteria bacterium]OUT41551.1 MAG: hypothetical protein CBB62_04250 [Micavibrio sp. TMED2]|tara:strand:+ start:2114 stop:3286 length:1173 start_codon:yes stop_codon:yes gene_type:complete
MRDKYLRYTLESGSTRIFNCLAVTQSILATQAEEQASEPLAINATDGQPDVATLATRPAPLFFENLGLNYTIFIKDMNPAYSHGDEDSPEKPIGMKIYVPFDTDNVYAGGKSIFASDRGFRNAITEVIGEGNHIRPESIARDLRLIEILDSMPALDPFLVRDMMISHGIEIDERYFQINDVEWNRIQDHIRQRIRPMVSLALPDGILHSEERMSEMIDAIWKASDMRKLQPLIKAFLLPVEQTAEIFYAWKGVAFFEYHYMQLSEPAIEFAKWLQSSAIPTHSITSPEQEELDRLRSSVRAKLKAHWNRATGILKDYNYSYERLFKEQGSAVDFMRFMGAAPEHFWHLGDAIIRLQHAVETWEKMTGLTPERRLEFENLRMTLLVMEDLL